MSFQHSTLIDKMPILGAAQTTRVIDTTLVVVASMSFTVAGATSPSIAIALQGSNAVPPNGATPNQGSAWGSAAWEPPESSWVQVYADSASISTTIAANGTVVLGVSADGLLLRWLRGVATPAANCGGALTVELFARGNP